MLLRKQCGVVHYLNMFYVAANELQYIAGMCYESMGTKLLLWKQYGVHYLMLSVIADELQ